MSFNDVIKKSILEGFNIDISIEKIIVTLLFAVVLGIYVFFIYKFKSKKSFYSKDFNAVLAGLPIITSAIVLAMQSSIVISLGMVGALSIVRFRNAVKNPLDLTCPFRDNVNNKCMIYEVRPEICRRFICSNTMEDIEKTKKLISKTRKDISMRNVFFNGPPLETILFRIILQLQKENSNE